MKKTTITWNWLLVIVVCITACKTKNKSFVPPEPDYRKAELWRIDTTQRNEKKVDVFYVLPTCVWDWKNEKGEVCNYANVYDASQCSLYNTSIHLACELFKPSCGFFSPLYRQITMNVWYKSEEEMNELYKLAHKDVVNAFKYYMENFNQGRPFVLAGHSQGAKAVIELLKHTITKEELKKMVAAYVFGYTLTQKELDEYPTLKPAKGENDYGVIILYNSVSNIPAILPLFYKNVVCINPLNWRTDETYASKKEHLGAVFMHQDGRMDTLRHAVGAQVDCSTHHLLIDGLNDDDFFIPLLQNLFSRGNYHCQELNLYFLNIQKNLARRIQSYISDNEF